MITLRQETVRSVTGDVRGAGTIGMGHNKDAGLPSGKSVYRPLRRLPPLVAYQWRARTYPWADRALRAAEAVYGTPEPAAERCKKCTYKFSAAGHKLICEGKKA